jgi:hypothetical protein
MKNEQAKMPPVMEVRFGNIRAAIWKNGGGTGPWYNVTFTRCYREGTEYKTGASFGRDDLLTLAKVADLAHSEIFALQREEHDSAED